MLKHEKGGHQSYVNHKFFLILAQMIDVSKDKFFLLYRVTQHLMHWPLQLQPQSVPILVLIKACKFISWFYTQYPPLVCSTVIIFCQKILSNHLLYC